MAFRAMSGSVFGTLGAPPSVDMAPLLSGDRFGTRAFSSTNTTMTANRLLASPVIAPDSGQISAIVLRVQAGSAGLCKIGLYANDPATNRPGALLAECTADLDTSATAYLAAAFSVNPAFARGSLYWPVAVFSGTPSVVTFNQAGPQSGGLAWAVGTPNVGRWLSGGLLGSFYRTADLTYVSGPTPFFPATFGACSATAAAGSPLFEFVKA